LIAFAGETFTVNFSGFDLLLRSGTLALALCLAARPAIAQETGYPISSPNETADSKTDRNSYSISGTVINSVTGEPVRRAAVQVAGQNESLTLTDAGGRFDLDGLTEGNIFLTVTKPGFYPDDSSHTTPVRVGKDAPAVVLKLTPSSVISGRVTTKDEQPLEGFQVHVVAKQNVDGRLVWVAQPNLARTDEEGEFRIVGLQAGTYYVVVDQSAGTTLTQTGIPNAREQAFASVFYPGVAEQSAASAIELVPGRDAELDFALSPEPIFKVSGTLTGIAKSVTNLTFDRKAGDDSDFSQRVSVADGKFQGRIPAGAYRVSGETPDSLGLSTPGATVVVRADEPELPIPLRAAVTIPIQMVREQGAAGSERKIPVQGGIPGVLLKLVPVSESASSANGWRGQAGGIPNVAPGTYRLEITTSGEWWVKAAQSGAADLLRDDLTVVEGEQPAPIEVTVRDGAGMVSGTVFPAEDPGRELVLLVQAHGSRNFIHVARAVEGNFGISGLAPGEYEIFALDDGDLLEYANPEVLSPYLSDAQHISVRPRENVTVNLGVTAVTR
jgi:hypothetical protein